MIPGVDFEKWDPQTPRLSYAQAALCVAQLPDEAIAILCRGPIEVKNTCNVCNALDPLVERKDPYAMALSEWHDNVGTDGLDTILERYIKGDPLDEVYSIITEIMGTGVYAKCCAIYAMANAERKNRKGAS